MYLTICQISGHEKEAEITLAEDICVSAKHGWGGINLDRDYNLKNLRLVHKSGSWNGRTDTPSSQCNGYWNNCANDEDRLGLYISEASREFPYEEVFSGYYCINIDEIGIVNTVDECYQLCIKQDLTKNAYGYCTFFSYRRTDKRCTIAL